MRKGDEIRQSAKKRQSDKNLGIDDDGSTNGDEGGHCVKAEGDA